MENGGVATALSPSPAAAAASQFCYQAAYKNGMKMWTQTNYTKNLATWTDVSQAFPGLIVPIMWYLLRCM